MKKIIAVAATVAAIVGVSSYATAHYAGKQIHTCVNPRTSALQWKRCKPAWTDVTWNKRGQRGPSGPQGPAGPPGDPGPAGVSGYERVAQVYAVMQGAAVYERTAQCPEGKKVVSGGARVTATLNGGSGEERTFDQDHWLRQSAPLDERGWVVVAEIHNSLPEVSTPVRLYVYAICADVAT